MAINKNFVIKNGVEVNTSLIVGDATLNKVGVGTTVPGYTLHVGGSRGGIGATDITITGIATVGTSGSTSAALSVVGVSSFQGDVNFLGSAGVSTISFDASLDKLNFADNARATFGSSDDLQIFHDGSNSIIRETGTGNIVLEGSGETLAVFADDGAVSLYYDNTNVFQTTPQGVNVTGVTTSLRLNVSGISTLDGGVRVGAAASIYTNGNVAFAGLATANGGVQVGTAVSIYTNGNIAAAGIVTANGGLVVGSAVTLAVNGNAAFAGIVTVGGDLKVTGDIEISEDLVLDTNLNILGVATIGQLHVTGIGTIDSDVRVGGASTFVEIAKFEDDLVVGVSTFFVDKSAGRIGIGTNVPSAALQVGATAGTGIGVSIHENGNAGFTGIVTVGGKITVGSGASVHASTGNAAFAGIVTTGGALIVGAGATISGDILPDADGSRDLGSSTLEFQDLFIDGTANIDSLAADTAAIGDLTDNRVVIAGSSGELEDDANFTFDGTKLNVGSGVTIQPHGGVSIAGITTIGGSLNVTGNSYFVGMVTFAGGTNGNITLGDSSGDNVVFNADVNSNVIPNTDNAYDLGSSGQQWKDIYVNGIGYIDTVSADGVGIATATIRDSAKLDVDGDARFSGKVAVKDGGNAGAGVTIFDNGNIAASGIITASSFVGSFSGTVTTATNVTVADESSDTTCFPLFATAATGDLAPKSGSNLTFNSNTGALTATSFAGNLTGGTVSGTTGTFSSDVDIADKIVHTGDTNTAIRFPAADTFTVETAGSEVFRADSSQRLVVGANSALSNVKIDSNLGSPLFQVEGSTYQTAAISLTRTANSSPYLYLNSGSSGSNATGSLGRIMFNGFDGTNYVAAAAISGLVNGTPGTNDMPGALLFQTSSDGSQVPTERLRITSAGRVNAVGIVSATGGVQVAAAATIFANGNATFSGIGTFGGTSHVRIPVGTTAQRDSNAVNGDIRYNTDLNSYEGYGNGAWGGLGGGTEIDVSVSSTSATNLTTFAHASYRSASMRIQITQGSSYQVGKYLLIHDGTTVTIVEEAAIATGDMLGSISGTINGSNVEVKVTMNSASSATVTTIIDKITV